MFTQFYNESIRKVVVAFGSLFNNIRIQNTNSSGVTELIRVPLSYGPREKFLRRIEEASSISGSSKVQITLPRLGFRITNIEYDSLRKRNSLTRRFHYTSGATGGHPTYSYAEVPYNLNFSLYGFSRTVTDALQITESILPYFTPEFVVSVNFDSLNSAVDIPIILNRVVMEEEYEGDYENRRVITTQYDFVVKSYVFGETKKENAILYTETTFFELVGDNYLIDGPTGALQRIDVGVSGESGDGGTGFTSGNFITFTNVYTVGPTGSGETAGTGYVDTYGNTYEGSTFNPPNTY